MNLRDLAAIMGKSVDDVKDMLEQNEIIELNLTESSKSEMNVKDDIKISEL